MDGRRLPSPSEPSPAANTVEVGVEGVAETATFTVVAELLEFDLSLPVGLNLIHIPLKVRAIDGMAGRIESVADLYGALGGAETVNYLITYDSRNSRMAQLISVTADRRHARG